MPRRLAALVVAGLVSAGCASAGSDGPDKEPRVLKGSAKGQTVKGTGYALKAPRGWAPRRTRVPGYGHADTHVFDLTDDDGFSDNFNVLLAEPGTYDVDEMESAALNEMGMIGARKRRVRAPVLVAGDPATHVSGRMTKDRVTYAVEQYHPVQDDQVYVVTFSFSPGLGRAARERTAELVLNSWRWRD